MLLLVALIPLSFRYRRHTLFMVLMVVLYFVLIMLASFLPPFLDEFLLPFMIGFVGIYQIGVLHLQMERKPFIVGKLFYVLVLLAVAFVEFFFFPLVVASYLLFAIFDTNAIKVISNRNRLELVFIFSYLALEIAFLILIFTGVSTYSGKETSTTLTLVPISFMVATIPTLIIMFSLMGNTAFGPRTRFVRFFNTFIVFGFLHFVALLVMFPLL
jgi:hypothetical protein